MEIIVGLSSAIALGISGLSKQPQYLPVGAVLSVGDRVIELEVAIAVFEQNKKLKYRAEVVQNRGMFFPVNSHRQVKAWMKDVLFPLERA